MPNCVFVSVTKYKAKEPLNEQVTGGLIHLVLRLNNTVSSLTPKHFTF